MNNYAVRTSQLDEAFEIYKNDNGEQDRLCEMLYPYLKGIIAPMIKEKNYIDEEALEDLVQDIMLTLFDKELQRFEGINAKFSTFCYAIAKNKALTYITKRNKRRMENIDDLYELEVKGAFGTPVAELYKDPQLVYIIQETRLEMLELFRKYIDCIMDSREKPYKVVSVCFSLILFHRYHPKTTMLGSPNWAYTCLKEMSVNQGADCFKNEINEWFKGIHFGWGVRQLLGRRGEENGLTIGEIIFGQHYTPKDFENWSVRMRKSIKNILMEREVQCNENGTSVELGL